MPDILDQLESKPWIPYTDHGVDNVPSLKQPNVTHTLMRHTSLLSEIVNDTVFSFYAPRERFTSRKLLDFYAKYTRWFSSLPEQLCLSNVSVPHVLVLQ